MRIVLCKGRFAGPVSGADEAFVNYATHLQRAGHLDSVALFYPAAKADPYRRRLRGAGIRVSYITSPLLLPLGLMLLRRVPFLAGFALLLPPRARRYVHRIWTRLWHWASMSQLERCRDFFRRCGADLVHVVTPDEGAALMIRAAHAAEVPVLYQELGTPRHLPELTIHYERFAEVIPLCSEVAALSPRLAREWQQRFRLSRPVSVLPLLVESPGRGPAGGRTRSGGIVYGFAARLEQGKGPLLLLEAFARLRGEIGKARLRFIGTGPQEDAAKALARALGVDEACTFVGYVRPEAKSEFLSGLDVFVLPTLAEGTPNSVIEAMAHGLPIVTSSVGGLPDMLCPESGILVPPGDATALAEAMRSLAADPAMRARMGRAARQRYEDLFSPEAVLPVLLETYARVAARGGRPGALGGSTRPAAHPWAMPLSA